MAIGSRRSHNFNRYGETMDHSIRQRRKEDGYDPEQIEDEEWNRAEEKGDEIRDQEAIDEIND